MSSRTRLAMIGVPAKLYEYLGAGRPILATGEEGGDLAAVLSASGVPHALVQCQDPGRIGEAIKGLVSGVASGTLRPGPEEMRLQFSRRALAGKLAALLDTLRKAKS